MEPWIRVSSKLVLCQCGVSEKYSSPQSHTANQYRSGMREALSWKWRSLGRPRPVMLVSGTILVIFSVMELFHAEAVATGDDAGVKLLAIISKENNSITAHNRKLLQSDGDGDDDANRIGTACSKDDIVIFQGSTAPLPDGIPAYSVQIVNTCVSGCSISNIHVNCGWFSSVRLVNPQVFKRIYYNDCLVNDGEALGPGQTLSFQYANSFRYPLSVSSVACRAEARG